MVKFLNLHTLKKPRIEFMLTFKTLFLFLPDREKADLSGIGIISQCLDTSAVL